MRVYAVAMMLCLANAARAGGQSRPQTEASSEHSVVVAAIDMPEPVRKALIAQYRGYQIVEARKISRTGSASTLYQVTFSKSGETVVARFLPDGRIDGVPRIRRAPPPSIAFAGAWRGVASCLPGYQPCVDQNIRYRIRTASDSNSFDIEMAQVLGDSVLALVRFPARSISSWQNLPAAAASVPGSSASRTILSSAVCDCAADCRRARYVRCDTNRLNRKPSNPKRPIPCTGF